MINITKRKRIESCISIVIALVISNYLMFKKNGDYSLSLIVLSIVVLIVGIFIKPVGNIFSLFWIKVTESIAWLNSKIVLTIVFYFILTPIAILYRIFTKDKFQLKRKKDTYFSLRNHKYNRDNLENIW